MCVRACRPLQKDVVGKKRRSGDGRTEIIGKNEEKTEAAIWRSTGVRGGDNKGTEIEWRPWRGMSL